MMLKHMLTASNGPPPPPSVVMAPATTLMNGHPASALPRTQPAADGIVLLTDIAPSHGAAAARLRNGSTISPLIAQQQQQLNLNLSQRLNQSHALNVSTLSTSKHSLGNSSGVSPGGAGGMVTMNGPVTQVVVPPAGQTTPKIANGGLRISRVGSHSGSTTLLPANVSRFMTRSKEAGIKEMLTSLGLLCLVSLLLALLSLIFLLKISPMATTDIRDLLRNEQLTIISADEYVVVYEVTLALCALTLSLNLCCLLVCAIQFLFAVKLVKSPQGGERMNKYLQKSSITRVCAVGGFFISIPVFLTGIILYTFIQFHSTPAIITSVFIGLGIIFCGCAMVHNVFVWQKEKTNAVRALAQQQREHQQSLRQPPTPPTPIELSKPCHPRDASGSVSPGVPTATLDLSSVTTTTPHELSTLV